MHHFSLPDRCGLYLGRHWHMLRSGLHLVFLSVCWHWMSSRQNPLKFAAATKNPGEVISKDK